MIRSGWISRLIVGCLALLLVCCKEPQALRATASAELTAVPPKSESSPKGGSGAGSPVFEAAGVRCLELITKGADARAELPLIVAIHGLGDRPENFAGWIQSFDQPARFIFPQGLISYGDGYSWFPLGGGLSHPDTEAGIRAAAKKLSDAIAAIRATRPTNTKTLVTGFSQGGALSFALALFHPESISAAFPVGGWIASPLPKSVPQGAPRLVALHGEADGRVPFQPTKEAVSQLSAMGWNAEIRSFAGVGHAMPDVLRKELLGLLEGAIR